MQHIYEYACELHKGFGKQAHSVNIQLRQAEDRKCLII